MRFPVVEGRLPEDDGTEFDGILVNRSLDRCSPVLNPLLSAVHRARAADDVAAAEWFPGQAEQLDAGCASDGTGWEPLAFEPEDGRRFLGRRFTNYVEASRAPWADVTETL